MKVFILIINYKSGFDKYHIDNNLIEIEFEYLAENIIRKREKPFNNKEFENVLVYIYDNNKSLDYISNVLLSITLEYELDKNSLLAYPEKFLFVFYIYNF